MHTITARNAQQALPIGLLLLKSRGKLESSRAGDVLRYPGPVATVLERPQERVIFHPWRDANPFFHIVEAAWMLAGRDDLASLTPYVKRMAEFSDDGGVTQPGAYGRRWRRWFLASKGCGPLGLIDQLDWAVKRLRANLSDRRVVIEMWDVEEDIEAADNNSADVPCNLSIMPWVIDGALHFTITNRSNDIIWGLYGANAVHFSVCLEYLAGRLGLKVGTMTTLSNNFHAYVNVMPSNATIDLAATGQTADPYTSFDPLVEPFGLFSGYPMDEDPMCWSDEVRERIIRDDLAAFFDRGPVAALETARWPWLRRVLAPMALAHQRHKGPRMGRREGVRGILASVAATDWRRAAAEWAERRYNGPAV